MFRVKRDKNESCQDYKIISDAIIKQNRNRTRAPGLYEIALKRYTDNMWKEQRKKDAANNPEFNLIREMRKHRDSEWYKQFAKRKGRPK